MKRIFTNLCVAVTCCFALVLPVRAQNIAVKSGEKIAFLGDSITEQGNNWQLGYVRLVISGLKANGVDVVAIPAGVSGHKSNDMLARVDADVIAKQPQWMTLSCGVNDVWHGVNGVPLEEYKKNITQIVEKAQAAHIKVVILTSTLIGEDVNNAANAQAVPYNEFLRALSKEKNLPLADLNNDMRAARVATGETDIKKNVLTGDGVHMNGAGNQVMATGVLRAFGLNPVQLQKAREDWLDIPFSVGAEIMVPLRQYEQLQKAAAAQNRPLKDLVNEQLKKYLDSLLEKPPIT